MNDAELANDLKKIDWAKHLDFGTIKLQIRDGKATLATIEKTVKLD